MEKINKFHKLSSKSGGGRRRKKNRSVRKTKKSDIIYYLYMKCLKNFCRVEVLEVL